MKYRISTNKTMTKHEIRRIIIKWILYFVCLVILYSVMRSGTFGTWQPFMIIPLAVAVSLYERELSSCVFALFCGYFIDISCGFIFGFSAVWLMFVCIAASLLSRNLIRVNFLNFMWISCIAVILEFSMYYLFNIILWNKEDKEIILDILIIPTVISTIVLSPVVFFIIKFINTKCDDSNRLRYYSPEITGDSDSVNIKE